MDTPIEGIPKLTDLTHSGEFLALGQTTLWYLALGLAFLLFVGALLLVFLRGRTAETVEQRLGSGLATYERLLNQLFLIFLGGLLVAGSYFFTTTLANRTHHWEHQRTAKQTQVFEGYRQEQPAPQVYYYKPETYIVQELRQGQLKDFEKTRYTRYTLNLASSQIQVKLTQIQDSSDPPKQKYKVHFVGEYTFVNTLKGIQHFRFLAEKPQNYELLEGFKVFQDGQELQSLVQEANQFAFELPPGQQSRFKISYQSQGDARWVYNAYNTQLSNFKLQVDADFPQAEYASGIVPHQVQALGQGKRYIWEFKDNVSVLNPFGVFTHRGTAPKTGLISRVLLLAPGILIWWFCLLLLTQRANAQTLFLITALFLSGILALTYGSRWMPALSVWLGIGLLMILLSACLRKNLKERVSLALTALFGFVLPVMALLTLYAGLALALTALLAVGLLIYHTQSKMPDSQPGEA